MKFSLKSLLLAATVLTPVAGIAETGTQQESASFNPVLFGLVSIVIALALCIAGLAYVYRQLAYAYRDKMRKERSAGNAIKTVALLLAASIMSVKSFAQEAATATENADAPLYVSGIPALDFYSLIIIIGFELLFVGFFATAIYRMAGTLRDKPQPVASEKRVFAPKLMQALTNSVAIKDEERIMLDHDYDGIHELDNSLPPWWKWGFVFTIFFAGAYLWYFHIGGGPSQEQEYIAAVENAEREKAAYMAKAGNAIDETNVKLIADKAELADAATLFKNTCASCHREDAGGNVGPNLTDNYWLHGGKLEDIFKSIKYGWKDKGMPEWQHNMSAKQIAGLASFVKTLSGKNVAGGKAPQGDLFTDAPETTPATDTAGKASAKLSDLGNNKQAQKG